MQIRQGGHLAAGRNPLKRQREEKSSKKKCIKNLNRNLALPAAKNSTAVRGLWRRRSFFIFLLREGGKGEA